MARAQENRSLDVSDLDSNPVAQFQAWFDDASKAGEPEPHAMTLATADADGAPSARTVLLRGVDARGFVFFTNHRSQKGRDLAANPRAALVFRWYRPERQVLVRGTVEQVSAGESDAYFSSRERGSQVSAAASDQSQVIRDRAVLEDRVAELERRYRGQSIPRPPQWGGYRVAPVEVEFWQGRRDRLHDRVRYRRQDGAWVRERLAP